MENEEDLDLFGNILSDDRGAGDGSTEGMNGDGAGFEIFTGPNKDAVIFCIDCANIQHMFGEGQLFKTTVETIYSFMRSKIVASDGSDQTAVVLYNVKTSANLLKQGGIYVYQSMGHLSAGRIQKIKDLSDVSLSDFDEAFGGSGLSDVSELLFVCSAEFKKNSASYRPRMFIFTTDDDPCGTNRRARDAAITRANDFHEGLSSGADINVIPLIDEFDVSKFWDKIVLFSAVSDGEDEEYASRFVSNALIQLSEMRDVVLKKIYKKRPLNRVDMYFGPSPTHMAFMAYTSYFSAPKPKQVDVDAKSFAPLRSSTSYVSDVTGALLDQDSIRTVYEIGRKGSGIEVAITKDEVMSMKQYVRVENISAPQNPGNVVSGVIELIGFGKESQWLRPEYCLGHGQFLYPQDERVAGSGMLANALIDRMVERGLVGVCRYVAKKNSQVLLAILVPQQEVINEDTNRQEISPGFHIVSLPFMEDVRSLSLPDTNMGFQMPKDPSAAAWRESQVAAARSVVESLTQEAWEPDMLDNPALREYYAQIEALALGLSQAELVTDLVHPDPDKVQHASVETVPIWLQSLGLDSTEGCSLSVGKTKRKFEHLKTETQTLSLDEIREKARTNSLAGFTVENLKTIIQSFPTVFNNVSATGRKAELIEKITVNVLKD
jgi:ATP-dependent DNA helicase 2 subunit 1